MIIDARSLPEDHHIHTTLCIIGGGVTSLALAKTLLDKGFQNIAIFESGGLDSDPATQDLSKPAGGNHYQDPTKTRHRQLGGTSNIWNTVVSGDPGAKYVPLDPIDYEPRDWVPNSGWPIGSSEINPHFPAVHQLCGLGPPTYSAADWSSPGKQPLPFRGSNIRSAVYQLAQGRPIRDDLRSQLSTDPRVKCYIYANVIELIADPAGQRLTGLKLQTLSGKKFCADALYYVLATGGLENARLLLASRSVWPAGIGNQNDVVGRYLMDHPLIATFARLTPHKNTLIRDAGFYDFHKNDNHWAIGRLGLAEETLRSERLLNSSMVLYPCLKGYRSKGVESLRHFRFALRDRKFAHAFLHGVNSAAHAYHLFAYRKLAKSYPIADRHFWADTDPAFFDSFEPELYLEQIPNPENRVLLSSERDALGMPRLTFQWKWSEQDEASSVRTQQIFAEALRSSGIADWLPMPVNKRFNPSSHHHIGTTRMHDDPKRGVTDRNARVHGVHNLYIAGSSLFTTGGFVNPTLIALALNMRLANHLASLA